MPGWRGAILNIDLSSRAVSREVPDAELLQHCIGGRGLAGFFLEDRCTLPWDDPAMPILLFTGPLVDTPSPTSGRMTIMSRSPLTGTMADASVGGSLGTMIKRAGWDGIIITGKGNDLTGIEIDNGEVTFTDAGHLAGLATGDITARLRHRGSVLALGPAAEKGVRFASAIIDGHYAAGRNGIGLCFAAKNIKYITVRGESRTDIHDRAELKRACEDIHRLVAASPALMGELGIGSFGTPALYDLMHARAIMPTNNFTETFFPPAPELNAFAVRNAYSPRTAACRGCHIGCKKVSSRGEALPEFETLSHFSALLGNSDLASVVEANRLCNELGMDTISTAATLACYAEIEDRKLAPEDILGLVRDIGTGRGIGAELSSGSKRYASRKGRPESSMSVKMQELPAYDPRGAVGMALAYAVSTRGGCHLRAYPVAHEILRKPVATDRFSFSGKARVIKLSEDQNAAVDSLTACRFVFFSATLVEYSRAFRAVTGLDLTAQDLLTAGERICYRERIMNARNGFTVEDDDLPERFFREQGSPVRDITIPPLDRQAFLQARSNYYIIRGLDESGLPTAKKAGELGLSWKQ
ncbi:MAG: aldehyde ferredoxin oxidoreductase family protein [Syntrophales bacterium]|jgi:aldehyde:ferredoxin oxidoreductase|nr:aldehyde ferredoxin oxidoreductase family protein [Syntrophales bacterium]MCK9528192.1 aldehyde ferredoxin oxidoreductase family protein [Syntrophales bacterium]MDX9921339.1 aldehyde ferredoxin oxidoreductase family protein [Syntrophales bacterium]